MSGRQRARAARAARRWRWAALLALALPVTATWAGPARAQSPEAPAPSPSPAVTWIRPEEVAGQADTLLQGLATALPDAAVRRTVERVDAALRGAAPDLDLLLRHVRTAAGQSSSFVELEDLRRELAASAKIFDVWGAPLAGEVKRLSEVRDQMQAAESLWRETRERPETAAAGDVVGRRVDGSLAALAETEAALRPWRTHVLAISDHLLDRRTAVAAADKRIATLLAAERENILVRSRPPLWDAGVRERLRDELPQVPAAVRAYARSTVDYIERDARPMVLQLLCAIVVVLLLRMLATSATAAPAAPGRERPIQPYALGLLLVLLATPWFHPASPQRFRHLLTIVALVPSARIALAVDGVRHRPIFVAVVLILLLDRVTLAVAPLPAVARVSAVASLASGLAVVSWVARRLRASAAPASWRRVARLAVVVLAVALAADIGGWSDLGAVVGRGSMAAVIMGVFVHAAVVGLEPVVVRVLGTPLARRSRMLDRRRALVRERAGFVLRVLGVVFWSTLVLRAVGLYDVAIAVLRAIANAGFSVGALSLSVGTLLAFASTLAASMLVARIVSGVLEEDVYPRARLPRGVPFVLSTLTRYAVYSFGFLFALAAAGIQLGQLSILLGGLGVGVGLGLQDVVKNFAAGLTLLFERRVHPGDIVQIPGQQIFGRVVSIGMRATLLKAWDGSEVVVPNGDLIAGAISNWTLSDRLCRVEVAVGVAYGTDPERVLALLLAVVRADERMLENPPPQALFTGFGESALNFTLRAWTDKGIDERAGLTSDLAVAVHRALGDAGITIPFPQRDLHLASVAPEAGAALAGPRREG
ncbi:MAG: mechanosensitive ion channel [Deltaproteobacteria bacterium]|nr:mechanosensitive ion channel [Deltaproteobacteria bacterium]